MKIKEHPIIFSEPMIQAIQDGRKTQTRRVIKPQPPEYWHGAVCETYRPTATRNGEEEPGQEVFGFADEEQGWRCPHGKPGDMLWLREAHRAEELEDGTDGIRYRADGSFVKIENTVDAMAQWLAMHDPRTPNRWRSSIHMPRWAARILLEITDIRAERVQDITEEDALAEGCWDMKSADGYTFRNAYRYLWDRINAKRGYGWDSNPGVWVIDFKEIEV